MIDWEKLQERIDVEINYLFKLSVKHIWISSAIVFFIFLVAWAIFSLSEAGCLLVLIALFIGIAHQKVLQMRDRFEVLSKEIPRKMKYDQPVDMLPGETREQALERRMGKNWYEKTVSDLLDARNRLEHERSALWGWELTIGLVGTFLWGFGDRLT